MKRLVRGEKGYVLIAALLVLLVLGLISGPLLSYMVSGLRAGHVFETGAAELYAADAGVEDGVWKIQHRDDADPHVGYIPCNPTSPARIYDITVNSQSVNNTEVSIICTENATGYVWNITSVATIGDNSHTKIESFVKYTPGSELNIFSGALASQTSIDLAKNTIINGNIYYCNGTLDESDIVNGNWTDQGCGQFPDQTQNVAFAQSFRNEALKGGTWNSTNIGSDMTFGPKYIDGDLTASSGVTITLAGIVYVRGSIRCENTLVIEGTGSLVAEADIYLKKVANYAVTGDSIIMSLNGDITIKKSSPSGTLTINALVYAPNGLISFDKDMTVIGGVVGGSIVADMDGSFTFVPKTSWDFPGGLPGAYTIETYDISRLS